MRIGMPGIAIMFFLAAPLIQCEKKEEAPQVHSRSPILNPSFEICNDDPVADFWEASTSTTGCSSKRTAGTSFMPSHGSYFTELKGSGCVASIFQKSVDLSDLTTLKFDWEANGKVGSFVTTASILFTANGTQTLWTKSYPTAGMTISDQKLEETVALPASSSVGKLTVQIDTTQPIPTQAPVGSGEGGAY